MNVFSADNRGIITSTEVINLLLNYQWNKLAKNWDVLKYVKRCNVNASWVPLRVHDFINLLL